MPHYKTKSNALHYLDDGVDPRSLPYFPADALKITDAEADAIRAAQVAPPIPVVPQVVTMRQARLALLAAGLLDGVDAIIAQSPRAVQITWDSSGTVDRTNPLIEALASQMGLSDTEVDDLFISAAQL